jgi:hypothetical protein
MTLLGWPFHLMFHVRERAVQQFSCISQELIRQEPVRGRAQRSLYG